MQPPCPSQKASSSPILPPPMAPLASQISKGELPLSARTNLAARASDAGGFLEAPCEQSSKQARMVP